jgi:RimJ/RimL family protein N-acetyltransferase
MTEHQNATQQEPAKVPEDVIAAGQAQAMATGEHIRLRAVLEEDLERLAALLAESPRPREPQPWTEQRLRKQFEAEKTLGLWTEKRRFYLAVRLGDGQVVGYLDERKQRVCRDLHFHVFDGEPDRDELGRDMLAAYMRLTLDWYEQVRIEAWVPACEQQAQQWLVDAGFQLEVVFEEMFMYQGRPEAEQLWGWINPRLENGMES